MREKYPKFGGGETKARGWMCLPPTLDGVRVGVVPFPTIADPGTPRLLSLGFARLSC